MLRPDGQGRRRFRSSGGGSNSGLPAFVGFTSGVAFALLFVMWQDRGSLSVSISTSTLAELSAQQDTSSKTYAAEKAAETGMQQPANTIVDFTNTTDIPAVVKSTASAAADAIDQLMDVDSLPHLVISYGNAAYFRFVHNWANSMQQIGAPYVIGAFDDAMMELCEQHRLVCVRAQFASAKNFRSDFAAFRAMGAIKAQLVLEVLERHPRLPLLVISDSDAVWLRQPWAYFEQRPAADFFISTDCLSIEMEDNWQPKHNKTTCGHVPGNSGHAFNTGLFATRNRPIARQLLRDWVDFLTDREREKDRWGRGVDDQLALNLLLDGDGKMDELGAQAISADEPRIIKAYNGTLKMQTLPVALFSGGHVAFVQRTPWKYGIQPIVIHLTYQRWGSDGKRARLREFGLWHIDPPEYYGADPGSTLKFLTYDNGVVPFVEAAAKHRYPGKREMPLFYKNWLGMSYQLAALRDALAAARMLGRAVVVPQLWCWCDYKEAPGILDSCMDRGADYEIPFACPLDFLMAVEVMDRQKLEYRNPGFLDLPQVPERIRRSRAIVRIAETPPIDHFPQATHIPGHAVAAWPGISQQQLQRVVQPVEAAGVLELRGFIPGVLGGWTKQEDMERFDDEWAANMAVTRWCCTTWGPSDVSYRTIPYAAPRQFKDGWQPWQAPVLTPPEWCDKVSTKDGNAGFTQLPQHPCKFLRDPQLLPEKPTL